MHLLRTRSFRRVSALLVTAVCLIGAAPSSAQAAEPDGIDLGSLLCGIRLGTMANTAAPTISGTAKVASTLTASPGTWSPTGATFTYQWLADGAAVTPATASPTYVVPAGAVGKKISVKVTASKCMKNPGSATSAQTAAVPAMTVLGYAVPTITGTPKVGQVLTANEGTWTPDGVTFTYKWLAEGTAITGATSKTYTPTAADVGKRIQVTVTGTKAGYLPTFVTSQATAAVMPATAAPVVNTVAPTITGTPKVGEKLTVSPGTWTPTGVTFTYQWLADGVAISGMTGTSYTPGSGVAGKKLSVAVTGAKAGYTSVTVNTAQTLPIVQLDQVGYAVPTITGTAKVGQTLTANEGTWTPDGVTFTYKWLAEGTAITGATSKTYTPTAADVGKRLQVTVTGSKTGYLSSFATSVATAAVVPASASPVANTVAPTISGTPKVGETLTVSPGTWTPTGVTFTYQWLVDGVAIEGATGTKFAPGSSRAGKKLSVAVTGSKAGYTPVTVTTAETAPIAQLPQLGHAVPTITGTPKVGQTLTANEGTWTPDGVTFTYQWYSEGVLVAGATAKTYVPTAADVDKRIQVRVTGAKPGYLTTFATSVATAKVVA